MENYYFGSIQRFRDLNNNNTHFILSHYLVDFQNVDFTDKSD